MKQTKYRDSNSKRLSIAVGKALISVKPRIAYRFTGNSLQVVIGFLYHQSIILYEQVCPDNLTVDFFRISICYEFFQQKTILFTQSCLVYYHGASVSLSETAMLEAERVQLSYSIDNSYQRWILHL